MLFFLSLRFAHVAALHILRSICPISCVIELSVAFFIQACSLKAAPQRSKIPSFPIWTALTVSKGSLIFSTTVGESYSQYNASEPRTRCCIRPQGLHCYHKYHISKRAVLGIRQTLSDPTILNFLMCNPDVRGRYHVSGASVIGCQRVRNGSSFIGVSRKDVSKVLFLGQILPQTFSCTANLNSRCSWCCKTASHNDSSPGSQCNHTKETENISSNEENIFFSCSKYYPRSRFSKVSPVLRVPPTAAPSVSGQRDLKKNEESLLQNVVQRLPKKELVHHTREEQRDSNPEDLCTQQQAEQQTLTHVPPSQKESIYIEHNKNLGLDTATSTTASSSSSTASYLSFTAGVADTLNRNWECVGKIGSPHALKGELKVHATTYKVEERLGTPGVKLFFAPASRSRLATVEIESTRPTGASRLLIVKFKGIDQREAAAALSGGDLLISKAQARAELPEGALLASDVTDFFVTVYQDPQQNKVGTVLRVLPKETFGLREAVLHAADDVLEIALYKDVAAKLLLHEYLPPTPPVPAELFEDSAMQTQHLEAAGVVLLFKCEVCMRKFRSYTRARAHELKCMMQKNASAIFPTHLCNEKQQQQKQEPHNYHFCPSEVHSNNSSVSGASSVQPSRPLLRIAQKTSIKTNSLDSTATTISPQEVAQHKKTPTAAETPTTTPTSSQKALGTPKNTILKSEKIGLTGFSSPFQSANAAAVVIEQKPDEKEGSLILLGSSEGSNHYLTNPTAKVASVVGSGTAAQNRGESKQWGKNHCSSQCSSLNTAEGHDLWTTIDEQGDGVEGVDWFEDDDEGYKEIGMTSATTLTGTTANNDRSSGGSTGEGFLAADADDMLLLQNLLDTRGRAVQEFTDLYAPAQKKTIFLPFVYNHTVFEINQQQRTISISAPPGLLG